MDPRQADDRLWFPATERNREPLGSVLQPLLPSRGLVLEIASGSGEHLCYLQQRFCSSHPSLRWQGSDPDPNHRASLAAWGQYLQCEAMSAPLDLDATIHPWPQLNPDLILCINMIHVAPWEASKGLLAEADQQLSSGSLLILYGHSGGLPAAAQAGDEVAAGEAGVPRVPHGHAALERPPRLRW